MLCQEAMIKDVVSGQSGQTVGEILKVLEIHHIRSVPIVDDNGIFLGLFGVKDILNSLLPVAATMDDGLESLNFVVGATPGIAKRLKKLKQKSLEEVMRTNCTVVYPETATWEAVRIMARHGSPIPVVQENTNKLVGMISSQTLLHELHEVLEEIEAEKESETDA